ncbi:phage holin family protein [Adhaeribacter swui]|uniref:Phage holin family protein n=1 Tax=Adhaeribacter swui TaxID=2086471 RepID=A0A7G7G606_9BACT|nr:phage holin family protein [Adhaeribacter swui]QNF32590.1 phage holin family protein [Adhaeribacter swui]
MLNDDKGSKTESLISNLMGYIDTRIDLIKLEVQTKLKDGFVGLMRAVVLGFAAFMALIFFNIFIGLLLNDLLDSHFWGFGIVTLFYVILLVIVIMGVDKKIFNNLADKTFDNTVYKDDKRNQPL